MMNLGDAQAGDVRIIDINEDGIIDEMIEQ